MTLILTDDFKEAVDSRRILPFIGAGFSKNVSKDLPLWSDVLAKWAAPLLNYDPAILATQGDHLQIAEYLSIKKLDGDVFAQLAQHCNDRHISVRQSRPHLLLSYLDVPSIFTTNWDSWIERAFEHEQLPYARIVTTADFVSPNVHRATSRKLGGPLYNDTELRRIKRLFPETQIVKYHGDFSDSSSIVFRERDYFGRLNFEHPLDIKLRNEIIGRSVLFIGYSFSDMNVRYIWHKLTAVTEAAGAGKPVTSYFVTHANNPLLKELLLKRNIETILLGATNIKRDLEWLLENMIKIQRS